MNAGRGGAGGGRCSERTRRGGGRAPWAAAAVLVSALGACTNEPASFYTVSLQYRGPAPGSIPPGTIDDASCYHHNAPLNLSVETSWGDRGRLEPTGPDTYGRTFLAVPVDQDLWLSFIDITLCPTGNLWVTRGVTANGVPLTRVEVVEGRARLAFRIEGSGTIVP